MAGIYSKENISNIYPLSPMQEGMFIDLKLFPHSTSYTQQVCFDIKGRFEIDKLHKGIGCVMERHDILRTIFVETKDGKLLQIVLKKYEAAIQYLDCSNLPDPGGKINSIQETAYNQPFDLSKGPLFRVQVIRRSQELHSILLTFQHIILDGWSLYTLLHELLYCYQNGSDKGLKTATPFVEYIRWIGSKNQEANATYWKQYLAGYTRAAIIPAMHNVDMGRFQPADHNIQMDGALMEKLRQYAQQCKVTPYNIILTCWAFVLSKFNNTEDVVFGTVTAGRNAAIAGIKEIVGVTANTIPVRVRFPAHARMQEVMHQVQLEAIGNESHHYMSLAAIQSYSPLRQELFDHIFIYENIEWTDVTEGVTHQEGMEISNFQVHGRTHYNLEITVYPHEQYIKLLYNELAIDGDLIRAIGTHLMEVLDAVVNDTSIRVNSIMQASVQPVETDAADFMDF